MKRLCCIFFSLLLVLTVIPCYLTASDEEPIFIRGIRTLGMGGAFTAIADDQNAVFFNPAGLTQRQGTQFTLFELNAGISEDVLKFYDFYKDKEDKLKNFSSLENDEQINILNDIENTITKYRADVRLGLPNLSYLSGPGSFSWGAGVYTQGEVGFKLKKDIFVPAVDIWGSLDGILAIPFAHKFNEVYFLPGGLSAGVTFKYIYRAKISELNKTILEFEDFSPLLQIGQGVGADLGALYQPTDRWNVGLQITDVGGTTLKYSEVKADKAGQVDKAAYESMIKSRYNMGLAYIPSKIYYWPYKAINTKDRIIFAFDVRDMLNSDDPLFESTGWKKVHMGTELRWGPLSIRGGFNSGYPSFGGGLRIPYLGLRFDYAYWGEELGRYAGQLPDWNHQITLALSWGDSKGRAYGKSVKSVDNNAEVKEQPQKLQEQNMKPLSSGTTNSAETPLNDTSNNADKSVDNSNQKTEQPTTGAADSTGTTVPLKEEKK